MRSRPTIAALAIATSAIGAPAALADGHAHRAGAVFTLTNGAAGNAVAVYARAADGTLHSAGTVATGGAGTGAGLGSQGALTLDRAGERLFAVDAGSDEITAFAVDGTRLRRTAHVPAGGAQPISVTVHENVLYVLNAGRGAAPGGIAGFRVSRRGELSLIAGSNRPLSGAAVAPAQISFDPTGDTLVVTEKATNAIDTYAVAGDGTAAGPDVHPSAGPTPFGFAFDARCTAIVSDAAGGAPGASGLSSYRVGGGAFTTVTAFSGAGQTAACWVVLGRHGRFAYTTNTGSGNVSSFRVAADGSLTLAQANAGATGAGPIDAATSRKGRFLYTLDSAAHGISVFRVARDGSLVKLAGQPGVVPGATGLAAK
jgi:6-phosphogluconolactonase